MRSCLSFIIALITVGLAASSPIDAAPPASPLRPDPRAIEHNRLIVDNSTFNINRSLSEYGRLLGPEFRRQVNQLRAGDVWLDLGAGNALALKEYLTAESVPGFALPPLSQRAHVVALGVQAPMRYAEAVEALRKRGSDTWENLDPLLDTRLEHAIQRRGADIYTEKVGYLHELSDEGIRGIRLATSVHGVFSYGEHLDQDLLRVLSLLKPAEGEVFIRLPNLKLNLRDGAGLAGPPEVAESRARQIFFSQVTGATLMRERGLPEGTLVRFRREHGAVTVPQLELTAMKESVPPHRSYRQTGVHLDEGAVVRGSVDGIRRLPARAPAVSLTERCWRGFARLIRW